MARLSGRRAWILGLVGLAVLLVAAGGASVAACRQTSLNCQLHGDTHTGLELTPGKIQLPRGFLAHTVAHDLVVPTDFDFFPDGRILVGERSGIVRRLSLDGSQSNVVVDVRRRVNDAFFRGLVAVAVDPDFDENGYVYVVYSARRPGTPHDSEAPTHVVFSRFELQGDHAGHEEILLGTDGAAAGSCGVLPPAADCLPAEVDHIGADILFARDGTLFLSTGEGGGAERVKETAFNAQDVDALGGKILHITRDGLGLPSNPFFEGDASANRAKVWALGVRNPFRMTLDAEGTPFVGDVGLETTDEIDRAPMGVNLGWPCYEGTEKTREYSSTARCKALYASGRGTTEPLIVVPHSGSIAITGGVFMAGNTYPGQSRSYVYGDWAQSWMRTVKLDPADGTPLEDPRTFAEGAGGPVTFLVGPDARLYYLALNYGALYRIDYGG